MRVLVTGGSGYIGSATVARLISDGYEAHVFDNLEHGHSEALPPKVPLLVGDLRHPADIEAAMAKVRPGAVIHFAAYALVGESMRQPERYFINNVTGGLNLLEAMRKNDVGQIVFSSTCATYGEPGDQDIDENTHQNPTNPYGESKLAFERILRWYGEIHGFKTIALRYFNACGATEELGEDRGELETHLIPLVLRVASGQSAHIKIFGDDYPTPDGSCVRDYIHISDLAEAHLLALQKQATGALNLGTGKGFSVKEIIEAARDVTGHSIPTAISPRRPGDPARLVASAEKARTILGWQPRYTDIKEIISTAWKWHVSHPEGYSS